MPDLIRRAFNGMDTLERGAIANPEKGRTVGHYWLRAHTSEMAADIWKRSPM
jgi:glucose-6-phosphate isomerase